MEESTLKCVKGSVHAKPSFCSLFPIASADTEVHDSGAASGGYLLRHTSKHSFQGVVCMNKIAICIRTMFIAVPHVLPGWHLLGDQLQIDMQKHTHIQQHQECVQIHYV